MKSPDICFLWNILGVEVRCSYDNVGKKYIKEKSLKHHGT